MDGPSLALIPTDTGPRAQLSVFNNYLLQQLSTLTIACLNNCSFCTIQAHSGQKRLENNTFSYLEQ